MKREPFFNGYRPQFYFRTGHAETSAERSLRLQIERLIQENKVRGGLRIDSTPAPKEGE